MRPKNLTDADFLRRFGTPIGQVPCNGCTSCCHGDAVRLLPQDDASQYETVPHQSMPNTLMLAHKANGDCIYLAEKSCSIHSRRPTQCRDMDCRLLAVHLTYTQARKLHSKELFKIQIWQQGRRFLRKAFNINKN